MVLTMCATFDLHLEQLDVKTVFFHEELEEEIYMLKSEGFCLKMKWELSLQVEQISIRSQTGADVLV